MTKTIGSHPPPPRWLAATPLVALLLAAFPAGATCPLNPCDCFPNAGLFDVVATGPFSVATGKISSSGSPEFFQTILDSDACASTAKVVGNNNAETETESIVLLATTGLAAKIRTKSIPSYDGNGVLIHGQVITAGGSVDGETFADFDIDPKVVVDVGNPAVVTCQGAVADLSTAAALLAGLTATQTIGDKIVKGVDDSIDATGPGVNLDGIHVIQAGKILVKPIGPGSSPEGGSLDIETDSATAAVIIRTTKLVVGNASAITATDPEKVIFVVTGPGPRVAIGREAEVDTAILAKDRVIVVGASSAVSNLYGQSVIVKGAEVTDGLDCGGSPSGAFLDPD